MKREHNKLSLKFETNSLAVHFDQDLFTLLILAEANTIYFPYPKLSNFDS